MARGKSSAKATRVQAQAPINAEAGDAAGSANGSAIEQQVVAFAEQLGRIVGTVQARAEGWLDPHALNDQMTRVRDGAASLLQQLGATIESKTEPSVRSGDRASVAHVTGSATVRPKGRSGGAVDARGKKHRKPTPNEPLRTSAGDKARITKMKAVNASRRRGRG